MRRQGGWIFLGLALSITAATFLVLASLHATLTTEGLDAQAVSTLQRQRQLARALAAHAALNLVYEERDIAAMPGLSLWLDGADANALFSDVEGVVPAALAQPVALWQDKSPHAHLLVQALLPLQPLRADTGDGRTALQFNGVARLQSALAAIAYQGGVSSFIVWRADAVGSEQVLLATQGVGLQADWRLDAGGQLQWRSGTGGSGDAGQPASALAWTLSSAVSDGEGASHWKNADSPATSAATFADANTGVLFAVGGDGLQGYAGAIAEILQFSRPLSSLERQRVEGYLARKWSIALPEGHRYRNGHALPCPADPGAAAAQLYGGYDDAGVEARDADLGTCAAQVGLLPWQTLGLARRDAFDAYGRPFTYAVTPTAAAAAGARRSAFCGQATGELDYAADAQRLHVSADGSEGAPLPAASVPVAVVLSHGPDRVGAYGANRARPPVPAASAEAASPQVPNYDEAGAAESRRLFAAAPLSLRRDAAYFDDFVWSATAAGLLQLAPAGGGCP